MDRDALLKQLTMLDFMATDLHLFLNTHPDDKEALVKYNEVILNANKLRCEYEQKHGPLCSYRSIGKDSWPWENEPWPWCEKFNFNIC